MKKINVLCIAFALLLFQCHENELVKPQQDQNDASSQTDNDARPAANTFFVSVTGNDAGDGSATKPWKTLMHAVSKTPANLNYTIQLSAGTFVENGLIEVPLGVNVIGAGIDQTILKAASSFYYYPTSPAYSTDKFLISLNEYNQLPGNQTLSGFTIDGDGKKLHGGIYVRHRNNVTIDGVKVQNTNFTGIWLWDVQSSTLKNSQIINSSWGSASYCSGSLNLGNLDHVEISNLNVNENTGYGIKAIGPSGENNIFNSTIHDSHISVTPTGLWSNGTAPNIAIELWQINLVRCQIYNTYVDNTISLVNSNAILPTGIQTMRLYNNTLDMDTRAKGAGYGLELTINDAEVDHNYFLKGTYGIANWSNPMKNWSIHHNTFYAIQGIYPGEVVRSQWSGLHNVSLYNNTIEFASDKTMNVVGAYGGTSENIDIKNNLFIDNNTAYNYYPNQLVHLENGAVLNVLTVKNNLFSRLPVGNVAGTYSNNLTSDPLITKTGVRPNPYYMPKSGSPLIDGGVNVGYTFSGTAPDIGALEYNGTANNSASTTTGVQVTLDSYAAVLSGKMTQGYDAQAQGGSYFYITPGNGNNYVIPPPGAAAFNFQLSKTDNYVVWAKVKSPTSSNQSSYVYNGNGKWVIWSAGVNIAWTWVKITDGSSVVLFPFTQGANQFQIAWNNENVQVDQVIVTNDLNYKPTS